MQSMKYKQSQGDHTLFIEHSNSEIVTILLVYVDDIIFTGNDEKEKNGLKYRLENEFEIKEKDYPSLSRSTAQSRTMPRPYPSLTP